MSDFMETFKNLPTGAKWGIGIGGVLVVLYIMNAGKGGSNASSGTSGSQQYLVVPYGGGGSGSGLQFSDDGSGSNGGSNGSPAGGASSSSPSPQTYTVENPLGKLFRSSTYNGAVNAAGGQNLKMTNGKNHWYDGKYETKNGQTAFVAAKGSPLVGDTTDHQIRTPSGQLVIAPTQAAAEALADGEWVDHKWQKIGG